jgi:hypothetical protein
MRTIFIGDVHGCLAELKALCAKLQLSAALDDLIFLGDLLDRGPDPAGTVRFVREGLPGHRVRGVKGNHEEKALRWLRHEDKVAAGKQPKNPMRPVPAGRQAEWRALTSEDRAFLEALPLTLQLNVAGEPWVAVHGGFLPGRSIADQEKKHADEIIRCRWVGADGRHAGMVGASREQPPGTFCWMERFDGRFHVACGHAIHSRTSPRVDRTPAGFEVWSIDTGCFAGGALTALVLDHDRPGHREVVQVSAAREYFPLDGDGDG